MHRSPVNRGCSVQEIKCNQGQKISNANPQIGDPRNRSLDHRRHLVSANRYLKRGVDYDSDSGL